jgi:predicted dehydrogenase
VEEEPRAVLIEKPLCTPDLTGAQELFQCAQRRGVHVFVGYDHVVGRAAEKFLQLTASGGLMPFDTLDVEFREHWGGIFAAHPWLNGPQDSYLGFWKRGGGALGEHSHAANLWQHFAHHLGAGRVVEVQAMLDFVSDGKVDYDKLCLINVRTENGLTGRIVQDVVTSPPRKWARVQGAHGYVEWQCSYRPGVDAVFSGNTRRSDPGEHLFPKTRPDDFILELQHIGAVVAGNPAASCLSLERGLDTMLLIAAAYKSACERRTVAINYSAGYTPAALE